MIKIKLFNRHYNLYDENEINVIIPAEQPSQLIFVSNQDQGTNKQHNKTKKD